MKPDASRSSVHDSGAAVAGHRTAMNVGACRRLRIARTAALATALWIGPGAGSALGLSLEIGQNFTAATSSTVRAMASFSSRPTPSDSGGRWASRRLTSPSILGSYSTRGADVGSPSRWTGPVREHRWTGDVAVDVNGKAGLEWFQIDPDTNIILQTGRIADDELELYYPSIAVNEFDQVVVGFGLHGRRQGKL
jgi:hypothetical protein